MFYKADMLVTFSDDDNDAVIPDFDISENDKVEENPMLPIVSAIHEQRLKKTAALPKSMMADLAGVIIYEYKIS